QIPNRCSASCTPLPVPPPQGGGNAVALLCPPATKSRAYTFPNASRNFTEPVERLRVLHEDTIARRLVRCPLAQQIEQQRIVRLVVVRHPGMRPVAAPNE